MSRQRPETIQSLEEKVDRLDELVETYISAGKYAEAETANKELEETKKKITAMKRQQTVEQQKAKEMELKEAYEKIAKEFNERWDKEMETFERESKLQLDELDVCSNCFYISIFYVLYYFIRVFRQGMQKKWKPLKLN